MTKPKSSARSRLINAILISVALGLLALTVWQNRERIREVLDRRIDGRLVALAFAIYLTGLMLTFVRWYLLVRAQGLPFRLRDALRLGFIGNVFNLVIPGAVGGDVVKAAFLYREQAKKTQAIASMVIDRLVGLLGLFLLAAAMGASIWPTAGPDVRRLTAVAGVAAASGGLGLAVLFTPALYRPLRRLVAGRGRLESILDGLGEMASAYRERPGVVLLTLAMAVAIFSLSVLAFYTISLTLFPKIPSLAQHFLIVPLVLFTTAVPLPFGALGLSEQVSEQLFLLVDHPDGAVAMMAFRVLMYAGGLVSIGVYLANLRQVRTLTEYAEQAGVSGDPETGLTPLDATPVDGSSPAPWPQGVGPRSMDEPGRPT